MTCFVEQEELDLCLIHPSWPEARLKIVITKLFYLKGGLDLDRFRFQGFIFGDEKKEELFFVFIGGMALAENTKLVDTVYLWGERLWIPAPEDYLKKLISVVEAI